MIGGQRLVQVFHQVAQKAMFGRGQLGHLLADIHTIRIGVQCQPSYLDACTGAENIAFTPAQQRPDTSLKLDQLEGLTT